MILSIVVDAILMFHFLAVPNNSKSGSDSDSGANSHYGIDSGLGIGPEIQLVSELELTLESDSIISMRVDRIGFFTAINTIEVS